MGRLDLADVASVQSFVEQVTHLVGSAGLQFLFLNAGVTGIGWLQVKRDFRNGHELRFSTNYIGHFLLAQGLRESLLTGSGHSSLQSGPSRVVVVSSRSHKFSPGLPGGPITELPTRAML